MAGKLSYRRRLYIYMLLVFIVFTVIITMFQYQREKQQRVDELELVLDSYNEIVHGFISHNSLRLPDDHKSLDSLVKMLPREEIRVTVIAKDGEVLYDSYRSDFYNMENHLSRPEVSVAAAEGDGTEVRLSTSTNQDFYYFAKKYDNYYVRTAMLYNISVSEFLSNRNLFLYFIVLLFLLTSVVLLYVSDRIGKAIVQLKDFSIKAGRGEPVEEQVRFPDNELGVISRQIVNIYNSLRNSNKELEIEKEKLIQHLQLSQVGVAIFTNKHEKILANNHFVQLMNLISDTQQTDVCDCLNMKEFEPALEFFRRLIDNPDSPRSELPVKRFSISKNMRYFDVQCILFHDNSYEISLTDVTRNVQQRILKQEMTSNIAHELRTPVSSVKGYLETLLSSPDIDSEKQHHFIKKAAGQVERLSEMIRDISLLTRIEEASALFKKEPVRVLSVIHDVIENMHHRILELNAVVDCSIDKSVVVNGNTALLYSIFQNLFENSLHYGGENIRITIREYFQDADKVYISFADNGPGIDEEHHARIFERFYRVDTGRARTNGGTGLGLAIVKNAVQFHYGEISVKSPKEGGTEFLFYLER